MPCAANERLQASSVCLAAIAKSEGLRLRAYWDHTGWAIGYGHHGPDITSATVWSEAQADAALKDADAVTAGDAVKQLVDVPLTQGEFDALLDFVFNEGINALKGSTLLALLNGGNYHAAGEQLLRWVYVGNEEEAGLRARREQELAWWRGVDAAPPSNPTPAPAPIADTGVRVLANIVNHPKTSATGFLIGLVSVLNVFAHQGIGLGKIGSGSVVAFLTALATVALGCLARDPGASNPPPPASGQH